MLVFKVLQKGFLEGDEASMLGAFFCLDGNLKSYKNEQENLKKLASS